MPRIVLPCILGLAIAAALVPASAAVAPAVPVEEAAQGTLRLAALHLSRPDTVPARPSPKLRDAPARDIDVTGPQR